VGDVLGCRALATKGVQDAEHASSDLPLGVKVAFGVGPFVLTVPIESGPSQGEFAARPTVAKRSGALVDARFFCTPALASVSALLYTTRDIFNAPSIAGSDVVIVHNPYASVPIRRGSLRFPKVEYFATADGLLAQAQQRA
jgi:hypothetical protein